MLIIAIHYSHTVHSIAAKTNHFYGGADCLKKLFPDSRKSTTETINYENNEMLPLTDEDIESYIIKKFVTFAKRSFTVLMIAMTIAMMIRMMKNLTPVTFIVIP